MTIINLANIAGPADRDLVQFESKQFNRNGPRVGHIALKSDRGPVEL